MSTDRFMIAVVAGALGDDARDAVRTARRAGFGGILFDAYALGVSIPDLSLTGRREFRHMLAAQDQQLVGLRVDIGAKGISAGADADRVVARVDRVMEAAAGLSCRLVCLDLGPLPRAPRKLETRRTITRDEAGVIIVPKPAQVSADDPGRGEEPIDPAAVAQVDAAMAEIGRRADRYGVAMALRSELASFSALERALKAADCPWFGVDLDPVAILRDAWSMDEVFSRLGATIKHVRARDALVGADRRTQAATVGRGSVNWGQLLSALHEGGYQGWMTVDPMELPDRVAAAAAAAEYLRGLRR